MVCGKCEAKLARPVVADKHKWDAAAGASGSGAGVKRTSGPMRGGLLGGPKRPGVSVGAPCRLCKGNVHLAGAHYCNTCAYKNGICSMCGTKVLDTSAYKMSNK
jgi:cysteine-rich PDZ-binding protein